MQESIRNTPEASGLNGCPDMLPNLTLLSRCGIAASMLIWQTWCPKIWLTLIVRLEVLLTAPRINRICFVPFSEKLGWSCKKEEHVLLAMQESINCPLNLLTAYESFQNQTGTPYPSGYKRQRVSFFSSVNSYRSQ